MRKDFRFSSLRGKERVVKHITLFAPGVGELDFDRRGAVVSALDVSYPEIKRVGADTLERSHTLSLGVGGSKLILEGYFIDEQALDPDCAEGGAATGTAAEMKRLLSSIAAPGRAFTLSVGERSRELYALSLTFAAEAPFSSPHAESFKLAAFSDDPYFRGGEISFAGTPDVSSPLIFPAHGAFTTGERESGGSVVVENGCDETCGFVLKARFTSAADSFVIESDREDGALSLDADIAAGDTVVIDTRSGKKSVRLEGGASLLSSLDGASAFFSAPPGKTTLRWSADSAAPPVVCVSLTPGYVGA